MASRRCRGLDPATARAHALLDLDQRTAAVSSPRRRGLAERAGQALEAATTTLLGCWSIDVYSRCAMLPGIDRYRLDAWPG
jgi:hypothetical protein